MLIEYLINLLLIIKLRIVEYSDYQNGNIDNQNTK
jgi:hypothetical protein